ncbi:hypothetical protein AC1031_005961 [Aphanomyces cochlioides]|nr:hypothetical protein AC1031_005961 [Aphanomyces cochlioides]
MTKFKYNLRLLKAPGAVFPKQFEIVSPDSVQWRDGITSKSLRFHSIGSLNDMPPVWSSELGGFMQGHHHVLLHTGALSGLWLQNMIPAILATLRQRADPSIIVVELYGIGEEIYDHLSDPTAIQISPSTKEHGPPTRLHLKESHDIRAFMKYIQLISIDAEDHLIFRVQLPQASGAWLTCCSLATMMLSSGGCFPWFADLLDTGSSAILTHLEPHARRTTECSVWTVLDSSSSTEVTLNTLIATFKWKRWLNIRVTNKLADHVAKCADQSAIQALATRRALEQQVSSLTNATKDLETSKATLAVKLTQAHHKIETLERTIQAMTADMERQRAAHNAAMTLAKQRQVQDEIKYAAIVEENEWLKRQWEMETKRKTYLEKHVAVTNGPSFKTKWLQAQATCRVLQSQLVVAKQLH